MSSQNVKFLETLKAHKRMIVYGTSFLMLITVIALLASVGADPCADCHESSGVLLGIIDDWESSEHADENVTCISCHGASASDPDAISHNGYTIAVVVTPDDCGQCHATEAQEFGQSLHSLGAVYYEYLFSAEKLPFLESQIEGGFIIIEGEEVVDAGTLRGCLACHGTNMTGKTTEDFRVWPNNGIGRINPDGSRGSCSACHSRHTFSIEEARHPETCGQCHMGPDHPQIEIYMESKHGNIYAAEGDSWNWGEDDWEAGVDFRTPTCAACHMSAASGVPVTHDVSSRLSWELESAISRHTDNTANSLGYSISDGTSWEVKRDRMKAVCEQCHSTTWVDNYYKQADIVVEIYNQKYTEAKAIVDELREDGLLTDESFDEPIEFKLYEMWHHEGRRARMGAFMMGPDYVQWHGFYEMLQDKIEIEHMAEELRSQEQQDLKDAETATWLNALIGIVLLETIVMAGLVFAYLSQRKKSKE
ncbi:MAG: cytochrome c3 family protein [Candidatus Thermoplasmatota archaeon]|nr:cytochrome c3 family protein [Candidatus Thermoplasmatota archaeon]